MSSILVYVVKKLIVFLFLIAIISCSKKNDVSPYGIQTDHSTNIDRQVQEQEEINWEELCYRILAEEGYPITTGNVEEFNIIASELYFQEKDDKALVIYNYVLMLSPDNDTAHYHLALILASKKSNGEDISSHEIYNHLVDAINLNRKWLSKALYENSFEAQRKEVEWEIINKLVENSYYLPIVENDEITFIDLLGNISNLEYEMDKCLIGNSNYTETYVNRYYPIYKILRNGKVGLLNCRGYEIATPIYDSINKIDGKFLYELTFMGKIGIMDNIGNKIFECKYNRLFQIDDELYYFRDDNGNGLIDTDETIVQSGFNFYDNISSFTDELLLAYTYNTYGLVNYFGAEVISMDQNYLDLKLAGNNIIATINTFSGEKMRLLTLNGEMKIDAIYDELRMLSYEIFAAKRNGKWGIVDKEGNILHNFIYDSIDYFSYYMIQLEYEGKYSFVNLLGKTIVSNCSIENWYNEGYAIISINDQFHYIDIYGNILNREPFEYCYSFNNELAAFKKDGKYGFIDKSGNIVINAEYDFATGFSNDLAAVKKDDKFGYIDIENEIILGFEYDNASNFRFNMAAVQIENKWYLIDKTGKLIDEQDWDSINLNASAENFIAVKNDEYWGYIEKNGELVINPQYVSIPNIDANSIQTVQFGQKYGVINDSGSLVIPIIYDSIQQISEEAFIVNRNNLYGVLDIKGDIVLKVENEIVLEPILGIYPFVKNGRFGYANSDGEIIYFSNDYESHEDVLLDTFTGK